MLRCGVPSVDAIALDLNSYHAACVEVIEKFATKTAIAEGTARFAVDKRTIFMRSFGMPTCKCNRGRRHSVVASVIVILVLVLLVCAAYLSFSLHVCGDEIAALAQMLRIDLAQWFATFRARA